MDSSAQAGVNSQESQSRVWPWLLLLAALHLGFSAFLNPPGYLTYDSGTYHLMAHTFATTGDFIPWNGYREYPSQELVVGQLRVQPSGHVVSQYPEFLSVLAWPFYTLFGYPGLFLLNAVAFLGINWILYRLTLLLFGHPGTALRAMVVYSFGTFAWEYSQSSYPHLSSTFFILLSIDAATRALLLPEHRTRHALVSGLALGAAMGIRLDSLFALPAPALVFLLARPIRWRELFALGAGLLPGLGFLAFTNQRKFGSPFPFSYGARDAEYISDLTWYLPIAAAGLGGVALLFLWQRLTPEIRNRALLGALALGLAAAAVFWQQTQGFLIRLGEGFWQIVVDIRIRDMSIQEPALGRSERGAMVYLGGVKKSLLQSCPYLVVLPFALWAALRDRPAQGRGTPWALVLLLLVPASYLAFFSYLAWHGSIALNMRYLNPALPSLAVLAAFYWQRVSAHLAIRRQVLVFGLVLVAGLAAFLGQFRIYQQEALFLDLPLLLAVCLLALELLRSFGRLSEQGAKVSVWLLTATIAFAGSLTFARDYPASAGQRSRQLVVTEQLVPLVEPDSIVFTDIPDICWGLIEVDKVRIARPDLDGYTTFADLATFHLEAGRKAYVALTPGQFDQARRRQIFKDFTLEPRKVWGHRGIPAFVLLELSQPGTPET